LLRLLSPKIAFEFFTLNYDGKKLVLLEVPSAYRHPVQFQNMEYIRVGSYKKPLKEFPEKERTLWQVFDNTPFESMNAMENVNDEDVLQLLDYPSYFNLMNLALPDNKLGILSRLDRDHLIAVSEIGKWNITNLGALLFANKLSDFSQISRKAMRVIFYKDNTRINDATAVMHVDLKVWCRTSITFSLPMRFSIRRSEKKCQSILNEPFGS